MGEEMVTVENLVKRYPKRPVNAVDGISFGVQRGEIFGLLGPNGAGKTTTISAMTTRLVPTSGRILVDDVDVARDPVAAKRRIGIVPQRNNLDRSLTARQNLVFHAAYFGFSRKERERKADTMLEELGLADRAGDRTDKFSGGMAQRLMIARSLMHDPELLFLDEPATGLDPQSRLFVYERIEELNARGLTVLITTHDMHEAERLCNRIAIVDHGKLLALDTADGLRRLVPGSSALELDVRFDGPANGSFDALLQSLEQLQGVERAEKVTTPVDLGVPQEAMAFIPPAALAAMRAKAEAAAGPPLVRLYSEDAAQLVAPAIELVGRHSGRVNDLRMMQATLEDVFIHLTGRALR